MIFDQLVIIMLLLLPGCPDNFRLLRSMIIGTKSVLRSYYSFIFVYLYFVAHPVEVFVTRAWLTQF